MIKEASFLLIILLLFTIIGPKVLRWYYSISIAEPQGSYDFIIVGAGTSGSVVANRLSEVSSVRTLVLEAGVEDPINPLVSVPFLVRTLPRSAFDWQYETESQQHSCHILKNKKSYWPRGKLLGGTSNLNYMLYARGSPLDYDAWEKLGASGWSYKDVFPYFKKAERVLAKNLQNSEFYGHDGYLKIDQAQSQCKATDWFIEAGREIGYKTINYNIEDEGFGFSQTTTANGKRQNAADAFLYPVVSQRNNIDVVAEAQVTKVLTQTGDDEIPRATGVEFVKNGKVYQVNASKEVIVSGGAIETPHLLMLSGIGPKEHLEEHKIKVVADLPGVGSNLHDHTFIPVGFDYPSADVDGIVFKTDEVISFKSIFKYLYNGTGILSTAGLEAFAYLKTNKNDPNERFKYPDVYFLFIPIQLSMQMSEDRSQTMNIEQEYLDNLHAQRRGEDKDDKFIDFHILLTVAHPRSVGTIRLNSAHYGDFPKIDPNYLSDERDIKASIRGFRVIEQLEQSEAFLSRGIKISLYAPQCEGYTEEPPRSDEFYECVARHNILTEYHPSATAKMGSKDDPMAVTDPRLRFHQAEIIIVKHLIQGRNNETSVYKVKGLRAADASVMPEITGCNIQAACYMIGEKVADMIKEDWDLK